MNCATPTACLKPNSVYGCEYKNKNQCAWHDLSTAKEQCGKWDACQAVYCSYNYPDFDGRWKHAKGMKSKNWDRFQGHTTLLCFARGEGAAYPSTTTSKSDYVYVKTPIDEIERIAEERAEAFKGKFVVSVQACLAKGADQYELQQWLVDGANWIGAHAIVQSAASQAGQPCLAVQEVKKTKLGNVVQRECTEGARSQQWYFDKNGHISFGTKRTKNAQCLTAGNSPTVSSCSTGSQQNWRVGNVPTMEQSVQKQKQKQRPDRKPHNVNYDSRVASRKQ